MKSSRTSQSVWLPQCWPKRKCQSTGIQQRPCVMRF